jgi:hypothetical protein
VQGVGVAGWAAAYYFPTDPSLGEAGRVAFAAVNDDIVRVFAVMLPGAVLAMVGQVLQAVGLLRARVVPAWVPWLSLATVATFVVPGNGLLGLVTAVPMAAASVALGYYAWRRVA